jgi:diguanylate cyclase (GGDEF)-like protein
VPAVSHYRAILIAAAAALYPVIFVALAVAEEPGLGLGHFYYFPIAMAALATGPRWGAAAGVAATAAYALGTLINPHFGPATVLTASSGIRLVTYTSMGALVGWFAQDHRDLVARLRLAAERDFLTGLLNTRAFDAAVGARIEQGRSFGLLIADLDNMKEINDGKGHAVGNEVLRRASEILAQRLRDEDQAARIGGDEFGVVTSLAETDTVRALRDRLAAALAEEGISMSFGWAVHPRDGGSPLVLLRAADERLYAQKLIRRRPAGTRDAGRPGRAEPLPARSQST